jgi:uncharacterized protein YbbC (DUF1343 family)
MDVLLSEYPDWIQGARIGLVSHRAAVNRQGVPSADRLQGAPGTKLAALFGPEHGFTGVAAAGETTRDDFHPAWHIPIFSLYGETRAPTRPMLDHVDVLVVEFQDLGARPYTYVSTLRLVLEAAASHGKPVIVADRPVPLPSRPDGPLLDPAFSSFVGLVPSPMQYAMTPAETACWLRDTLNLNLDLRVAPMRHYHREPLRQPSWPPWVPPSPRIHSWDTACLFTTTVFGEALPALDYGSGTDHPFQVIAAPWLDPNSLIRRLHACPIPGLSLSPRRYRAASGLYAAQVLDGVHLNITDHSAFRPVTSSVILLDHIQQLAGHERLWSTPGTRPDWFDKLYGTSRVRHALQSGQSGSSIVDTWQADLDAFDAERSTHLLYPEKSLS